jgi:hypothetical protein
MNLDKLFPLPLDPPGQKNFESQRAQPALPHGARIVAIVQDEEELRDRMIVAGLEPDLEKFIAGARAQMAEGPCSAVLVLLRKQRAYGFMAVRFPFGGGIGMDLTVVTFAEHLRSTIADELTSFLECRAALILAEAVIDDEPEVELAS